MKFSLGLRARLMLGAVCVLAPTAAFATDVIGNVSDATETRTLQGAQVTIVELDRTTTADDNGDYRIVDVPAGTYTLRVTYVGVPPVTKAITVPETGTVTQNVALGDIGNDILVIGQRANMFSALQRQRAADGVESVLTRDAVGQFPDQNVAESLRRLPGINILNDQGEGRFVSVRGLDPNLNSTSINGARLPAPESDVRSVALDVISSDQIESIEVKKSLTPDMDADTLGASIEIKTTSAFDRKKDLLTFRVEGSHSDKRGGVTPKADFNFSKRLTDTFGVSGGASYYKRRFSTDGVETGGWKTAKNGIVYTDEPEYRDYDVNRERFNASLSFDYKPSDTTTLYARGLYSIFNDQEYRNRLAFVFDGEPTSADGDVVHFSDANDRIEVRRDVKDRFERQRVRSVVLGGDTDTGDWKLSYSGSWSRSSEFEHGSLDPTRFRARFKNNGVSLDYDYSNDHLPVFDITSGEAKFLDPTQYAFNRVEKTALSASIDEEYGLRGDIARTFGGKDGAFTIQAGAKARWRTKSYDFNMDYYGKYNGSYTLADVPGSQSYSFLDIQPLPSGPGARAFFKNNFDNFVLDEDESAFESAIADYRATEDIVSGYLLGRWESTTLRAIAGVRVEHTKNKLYGSLVDEDDPETVAPNQFSRSYTNWLPSVNLRYAPTGKLVFRAAAYKSLMRPNLKDMAPRFQINEDLEAEFGNPYLKPYTAWNFDASAEYYFAKDGAVTLNYFHKEINDFIFTSTNYSSGTIYGIDYSQITQAQNGKTAIINGIEFSYSQVLSFLPAPFDGLLVNFNYTFTDAKGTLPDDRRIDLPSASRNTFNAVLGYEKGPLSLRLAGTYRDKYVDEVGDAANNDRIVNNHFQLDATAKYRVTKGVQVYMDWVNINNAPYYAYQNYDGRKRLLQYEEYSWTAKGGVKITF